MIWQLIYRTVNMLRWGVGTGADLSAAQIDKNFADLEERLYDVETNPPAANSIGNIIQSGNSSIYVYLQDGTVFGPFPMPVPNLRFLSAGWLPSSGMFLGDLFVYERTGFYMVLRDHVSAEAFDPAAQDTDGDLYRLLFDPFSGSAPVEIDGDTDGLYVPELDDANQYLIYDNSTDCTVLIPADDDVPFAIGTELHFRQDGTGAVVIEGDTGVTVKAARPGFDTETPWQGANCTVKKVEANVWHYMGPGTETTA